MICSHISVRKSSVVTRHLTLLLAVFRCRTRCPILDQVKPKLSPGRKDRGRNLLIVDASLAIPLVSLGLGWFLFLAGSIGLGHHNN